MVAGIRPASLEARCQTRSRLWCFPVAAFSVAPPRHDKGAGAPPAMKVASQERPHRKDLSRDLACRWRYVYSHIESWPPVSA